MNRFGRPLLLTLLILPLLAGLLPAQPVVPPAKPYAEVAAALEKMIGQELESKQLPAVSIALVDDQKIVWARGFGQADPAAKVPATAQTVYRVGSVSKLFTDIAIMQLVEQGKLDLDAPITTYLPNFKPKNPFGTAITLRHLMSHRAGLVREPPVGNYFDPSELSLAKMVESLNRTELVLKPESKTKYSNAGVAVAGYVLEATQKQAFARYLSQSVLQPLEMTSSSFEPSPTVTRDLAKALMWTYHGRDFLAPTFELGMAPAGCMYSTVLDLGKFLSVLFAGGKGPKGQLLRSETLEQMYRPQYAKPEEKTGFGIGFLVQDFEGRRRIGHDGAIYGFATTLGALPEDRLGVVVVASRDCVNPVTDHIADQALHLMLAARQGKPLPAVPQSKPLALSTVREMEGRYQSDKRTLDLIEQETRLFALPARGGFLVELRGNDAGLITDGRLGHGTALTEVDRKESFRIGDRSWKRQPTAKPEPSPEKWAGLIGEYGWDHNTLFILEKDGKLHALIEWFFLYPLGEESANVFKFPDHGLYHDEKLVFTRDTTGRATRVEAASVVFVRRKVDGENGETFRIEPQRPIEVLRKQAAAASPPQEKGEFRKTDLVDLTALDPTIKLDIRYASTNNFLSTPFYRSARAFMQRPAAEALVRVHRRLADQGHGLLVYDAYRPWSVTKMFWDATPEKFHHFVADPSKGSRHNRGCAVDLTLYDRKTGKPVDMVSGYDEFSDRAYPHYWGGTSLQRWHRDLLRRAMYAEGFTIYEAEWWHFDFKDWQKYPILNLAFEELGK
jgi:serine beta-lactamase-like protein LACTB